MTQSARKRQCLLTPVASNGQLTGEQVIRHLVHEGWYVFGDRTPGRRDLQPGDRLCFYLKGVGVVGEVEVASEARRNRLSFVHDTKRFPWAFMVRNVRLFFDEPVALDEPLRMSLDAFKGRNASPWNWLVLTTRRLSERDFNLLTGRIVR